MTGKEYYGRRVTGIEKRNYCMNIVLVHGAWADGSCWSAVIERLQAGGYHATAPQFPLTSLPGPSAHPLGKDGTT